MTAKAKPRSVEAAANPDHDMAVLGPLGVLGTSITTTAISTYASLGLNYPSARMIYVLGRHGPRSGSALSLQMGVDPASVSRTTRTLLDRELIGIDKLRRLSLTDKGHAAWSSIAAVVAERNRRLLHGLTEEDRVRLIGYLAQLQANMQAVAGIKAGAENGFSDLLGTV